MSEDYKPKKRKIGSDKVYCIFCYKEIPELAEYHYIKSCHGTRPVCVDCALREGLIKEGQTWTR